jgi:hypothetical protein
VLMEIKFRIEADYKYFIASDVVIKHVPTLLHVDSDAQTYKTEKDKSIYVINFVTLNREKHFGLWIIKDPSSLKKLHH